MSKRITTRWYIGAWVVWLIGFIALGLTMRANSGSASPPPASIIAYVVMAVAAVVMLVMWIRALVKLGMQHAWGWFVGVLILHLVGLGIVGMAAYSISGPADEAFVAIRPSTPV